MSTKIAINGFGRIGRLFLRAIAKQGADLEVVAVNDLTDAATLAHLLKYDSVHGVWPGEVSHTDDAIVVEGRTIKVLSAGDISLLPWRELGVEVAVECTGLFTDRPQASRHLDQGAKKVLISAPAKDPDLTVVMGVNDADYDPARHHIVSNASCTTNCLAPVVKVLLDSFGIEQGLMTTIHAYTADQRLVDAIHKDRRRARAAALSMVPTTTGAAVAVAEVIPELKGKLDGLAIRVPTPNVSLVDFVCRVGREVSREEVNRALAEAAQGPLQGIVNFVTEPLVSIDFNHSAYSSSVDAALTAVIGGRLVKVLCWYDNEYGYSNRLVDLALYVGKSLER